VIPVFGGFNDPTATVEINHLPGGKNLTFKLKLVEFLE
jgi:FKBP-type peptidyl-prolyl cis-trans isomerase 2